MAWNDLFIRIGCTEWCFQNLLLRAKISFPLSVVNFILPIIAEALQNYNRLVFIKKLSVITTTMELWVFGINSPNLLFYKFSFACRLISLCFCCSLYPRPQVPTDAAVFAPLDNPLPGYWAMLDVPPSFRSPLSLGNPRPLLNPLPTLVLKRDTSFRIWTCGGPTSICASFLLVNGPGCLISDLPAAAYQGILQIPLLHLCLILL